ncbi:MAG TPA: sigma 54-interacting transcriptional regulator [Kofleriaceae bacterium]|nr:sigma 54-interacting transcriptional regulator [Kofleriaceae bacterium]
MSEPAPAALPAHPQLFAIAVCDDLSEPSARHVLDDIDEVRFGRGARRHTRTLVDGKHVLELRVPDARMSTDHGKLVRTSGGWMLEDPASKNGTVVNGAITRHSVVGDETVIELGHTFFVLRGGPLEPNAPLDVRDDTLVAVHPSFATFDGELADRFAAMVRIATTEVSVMLQGETGTGKEVVAQAIHALSGRTGALVAVNCGALPHQLVEAELFGYRRGAFTGAATDRLGYIRSADNGTLFLDEVGELPASSQAAFLRVLQEREVVPVGGERPISVDVRLCSATLQDLDALVDKGTLRRDLYARLLGFTLGLPQLRERLVDLGLLTRRLLATIPNGSKVKLAPAVLRAMLAYRWPLNIRELGKVLTTAVALCDGTIELTHLPEAIRKPPAPEPEHDNPEELRERLVRLLTEHQGNVLAVSKVMGARRTQIYRWVHRFGIRVDQFRH